MYLLGVWVVASLVLAALVGVVVLSQAVVGAVRRATGRKTYPRSAPIPQG